VGANAATISPSADTRDGRVHFTPANLVTTLHRSLEPARTARILRQIFPDPKKFGHHPPLPGHQVSVAEAVATYLFNSQLVSLPQGGMALIAPVECQRSSVVRSYLDSLVAANDNPVNAVHYFDVRESMRNGGGPACLRLRIVLTEAQLRATLPHVLFDLHLYAKLVAWVQRYYRDTLHPHDLQDPELVKESFSALKALEAILHIQILPA
jgi:succinylarginine dihydrolase